MLKLAAIQAVLSASVILKGRCKGKHLAVKILFSALLSCVTYCALIFLGLDSFMVPVASGQLCCLSADLIIGRKDSVFPSLCLFLCTDCAFVPLEMGENEAWNYGIYLALLFLFIVLSFPAERGKFADPADFFPEKCSEYAGKLVSEANDVNDIMPVTDAVVGSMLYNMREEARKKGTDIVYNITYDMEDILCNGFECNKIIGNLLQNAIDALNTEEDKKQGIKLSIFKRRGNTVIISENRFIGDPDRIARVFEAGFSTKRGHDGIGLSMVMRTVKAYGGREYPEFDGNRIRFVVNIPNKINLSAGREAK